jgi:hypothetical protein
MTLRLLVSAVLLSGALFADPQPRPKELRKGGLLMPPPGQAEALEKLSRLTPDERERVLGKMAPARRQMLERRLEQWNNMPPGQKRRMEESLEAFRQLTPEQQETMRKLYRRFNDTLPDAKRAEGRRALSLLRRMEPEQRKRALNGPRLKASFTDTERDLLAEMCEKLPD